MSFTKVTGAALAALGVAGIAHQSYADLRLKLATHGLTRRQVTCETGNILTCHLRRGAPGAPTVVLDAGLLSSSVAWLLVLDHLGPDTTVVLYDRAGYRGSLRRSPEAYRFGESISDLVDVIDATVDGDCVLVGHSLGGYLSHRAAAQVSQRVRGLVLVDPMHPRQLLASPKQRAGAVPTGMTLRLAPMTMFFGGGLLLDKKGLLAHAEGNPHRRALSWELSSSSAWRASKREWSYSYSFMLDGGPPLAELAVPVRVLAATSTLDDVPEQRQLFEEYAASGTSGEIITLDGSSHLSILHGTDHAPRVAAEIDRAVAEWVN